MAQISPVERTSLHTQSKTKRQVPPEQASPVGNISREISQAFILPDPDAVDVENGGVDYLGQNNYEQRFVLMIMPTSFSSCLMS